MCNRIRVFLLNPLNPGFNYGQAAEIKMAIPRHPKQRQRRLGFTLGEMLVACSLSMVVISISTALCVHVNHTWRDVRHQRLALAELANQMDRLTCLPSETLKQDISDLKPSSWIDASLKQPELKGQIEDSNLGLRVTLQLDWQRRYPAKPMELTGWVQDFTNPLEKAASDE